MLGGYFGLNYCSLAACFGWCFCVIFVDFLLNFVCCLVCLIVVVANGVWFGFNFWYLVWFGLLLIDDLRVILLVGCLSLLLFDRA